jgi:hypothetical protein
MGGNGGDYLQVPEAASGNMGIPHAMALRQTGKLRYECSPARVPCFSYGRVIWSFEWGTVGRLARDAQACGVWRAAGFLCKRITPA